MNEKHYTSPPGTAKGGSMTEDEIAKLLNNPKNSYGWIKGHSYIQMPGKGVRRLDKLVLGLLRTAIQQEGERILPELHKIWANIPLTPDTGARLKIKELIASLTEEKAEGK